MQKTAKKQIVKKVSVKAKNTKTAPAKPEAKASVKKEKSEPTNAERKEAIATLKAKAKAKAKGKPTAKAVEPTKPPTKAPAKAVEPVVAEPVVAEPVDPITPVTANMNEFAEDNRKAIKSILEETKLDWDVRKEDLIAISSFESNNTLGVHLPTPNSGIYRNDNNVHLGTTSKAYTIYQNADLVECIYEASKAVNLKITGGGECYDGSRVFLDLQLEDVYVGNAKIKRSITCLNAHNGRGSVQFGATYTICQIAKGGNVVKMNKFTKIFGDMEKFYHYTNVSTRVKKAISGLFESLSKEEKTIETMKQMTKVKVNEKLLHEIVLKCFRVDLNQQSGNVATRTLNNITAVSNVMNTQIKNEDGTLWGLFNGILATTAERTPKNQDTDEYVKAGRGNLVNMKAFDIIQKYLANA